MKRRKKEAEILARFEDRTLSGIKHDRRAETL